ncbi:hypothetical protein SDC9_127512 [bioreactor metagenome]|uniref:Uncharacterized protein n=1 Tax=bioreactor metagenome TaxID=1076179 RepID=A0A645CUA3_9ZZZZ
MAALDDFNGLGQVSALDDGVNKLHAAAHSMGVHTGDAEARVVKALLHAALVLHQNDADEDGADGQLVLNQNAYEITHGKAARVSQQACHVAEVLHNLADGHQPDGNLKKAQQGRQGPFAPGNEDNTQSSQGYVADAGTKDQQGENDPGKQRTSRELFKNGHGGPPCGECWLRPG